MIKVKKDFTDSKDGFKPYKVDDTASFDKQREDELVENGYAEKVNEKKTKKAPTKKEDKNGKPKTDKK